MIIRKLFRFEAAHIVRLCMSQRCSQNIHGHSYIVEVFIESSVLDRAGMVMDFGLMKKDIGNFIDLFDHSYIGWSGDQSNMNVSALAGNDRSIIMPFIPSAEIFAAVFYQAIHRILTATKFYNGEVVSLKSVRVHETATGYAEAFMNDMRFIDSVQMNGDTYVFSDDLRSGMSKIVGSIFAVGVVNTNDRR